jgi:hypothetical protein
MNGSKDLYDYLMNKYGEEAQLIMLFEEQAELNVEMTKLCRTHTFIPKKEHLKRIVSELADNFIMLEQWVNKFGVESEVDLTMQYKLQRTAERSGFNDKAKDILPNDAVIEGDEE